MVSKDYPFQPIPFTNVTIQDSFWQPRLKTNHDITIPYDFRKCEETGRIDNFVKAARLMDGPHIGIQFNDSDVFKVIEGAAYDLQRHPNPELELYIDDVIDKIAAAQEPDGYLYTARTIDPAHPHEMSGTERWSQLKTSHELYNLGHMYEAAVAYYQATGKRAFLDVALKSANLINDVFRPDGLRDVPGHQEIELGLVKLYRATGDEKYLNLAKFFLDERGNAAGHSLQSAFDNPGYMQDHLPVTEQREAVGHAVRATYMYAAMVDVAALKDDEAYKTAVRALWDNVVQKKLSLTGGIGARHTGETFSEAYDLPNQAAYNETCAAIGSIYWSHRMFLLDGDPKYYDLLERTLYNGFLSGISLSGNEFFYVNPLESDNEYAFNAEHTLTRQAWFNCSCCPTNVVRLLPSLPGYIYATRDDHLYVNLYTGSSMVVSIANQDVRLIQTTTYPWDGTIQLAIDSSEPAHFTLSLRVPGWVNGQPVPTSDLYRYVNDQPGRIALTVNSVSQPVHQEGGYIHLERTWQAGDVVELVLPMPIRRVVAHANIADTRGKVALERGPLVYAAEGIDNGGNALSIFLDDSTHLSAEHHPVFLGGITMITGEGITAIPYYAWGHRGNTTMAVWYKRTRTTST
ncbi:glycoside hydrolase family 127 protein [Phototrophicus methaneseepsis]|nr:glycoside hydrolase family 127 protein [Phototrophicus methaneseepsis]